MINRLIAICIVLLTAAALALLELSVAFDLLRTQQGRSGGRVEVQKQ